MLELLPCMWLEGVILHGPAIHPDAVRQNGSHVWLAFLWGLIRLIPVGMIFIIHVKMVPAVKSIVDAFATVHSCHIIPAFPARVTTPLNVVSRTALRQGFQDLVSITGVLNTLWYQKFPSQVAFGTYQIACPIAIPRIITFIVAAPHGECFCIWLVVFALHLVGLHFCLGQRWQQHSEDADNCNDNQ